MDEPNLTWKSTQGLERGWGRNKSKRKRNSGKGREPTTRIPDQWKRGATLQEITDTFYDRTILPSGGANSGVPRTMLWAGRGCGDSRDVDAAIVNNSTNSDAWTKLGHLTVGKCNDGDLAEWMIGHAIPVTFCKRFWKEQKMDMMGICYDTKISTDKTFPPEVGIYADAPDNSTRKKITIVDADIFISKDPYIQGKFQEIHRNNLRDALVDTYGDQVDQWTFDDLLRASYGLKHKVESITKYFREDSPSEAQDDDEPPAPADGDPGPAPKAPKAKGKDKPGSKQPQGAAPKDNDVPSVGKGHGVRKGNKPTFALMTRILALELPTSARIGLGLKQPGFHRALTMSVT